MTTPQPPKPQEKKCSCLKNHGKEWKTAHYTDCPLFVDLTGCICPFKEEYSAGEHWNDDCPLYSPPAQGEKIVKLNSDFMKDAHFEIKINIDGVEHNSVCDCFPTQEEIGERTLHGPHSICPERAGLYCTDTPCCQCSKHKCQPPQQKEPETWEERFKERFYYQGEFKIGSKVITYGTPTDIKTFIAKELATARTEAETKGWNNGYNHAYRLGRLHTLDQIISVLGHQPDLCHCVSAVMKIKQNDPLLESQKKS